LKRKRDEEIGNTQHEIEDRSDQEAPRVRKKREGETKRGLVQKEKIRE
jgi:hypothetical protein